MGDYLGMTIETVCPEVYRDCATAVSYACAPAARLKF
ncbi:hypothetical protein [Agrobacterium sp. CG674]